MTQPESSTVERTVIARTESAQVSPAKVYQMFEQLCESFISAPHARTSPIHQKYPNVLYRKWCFCVSLNLRYTKSRKLQPSIKRIVVASNNCNAPVSAEDEKYTNAHKKATHTMALAPDSYTANAITNAL